MNQMLNDNLIYITKIELDSKIYCVFRQKEDLSFVFFRLENEDYKLVNIDEYNKLFKIFNEDSSTIYRYTDNNNSLILLSNNFMMGADSNVVKFCKGTKLRSENQFILNINGVSEPIEFSYDLIIDERDESKDIKLVNDFITNTFKEFFETKLNDKHSYLTKERLKNLLNSIKFQVFLTMKQDETEVGGIYNSGENDSERIYIFPHIVNYGKFEGMNAEKLIKEKPVNFAGTITHEFSHLLSNKLFNEVLFQGDAGFSRNYNGSRNFNALNEAITEIYSQKGEIFSGYKPVVDYVKRIYLPKNYASFYMERDLESFIRSVSRYYSVKESLIYGYYLKLDAYLKLRLNRIENSLIEKDLNNEILFLNLCKLKSTNKRKLIEEFDTLTNLNFANIKDLDINKFDIDVAKKEFVSSMLERYFALKENNKDFFDWLKKKALKYNVNVKEIESRVNLSKISKENKSKLFYNYLNKLMQEEYKNVDDFICYVLTFSKMQKRYFLINAMNEQESYFKRKLTEEEICKILVYADAETIFMFESFWKDLPNFSSLVYKTLASKVDVSVILSITEKYSSTYGKGNVNLIFEQYLKNIDLSTRRSFLKLVPKSFLDLDIYRAKEIFETMLNNESKEKDYACALFISKMIIQNGYNVNKTLKFMNVTNNKENVLNAITFIKPSIWKANTYLNYLMECKNFYKNSNVFDLLNSKFAIDINNYAEFTANVQAGFAVFSVADFGNGNDDNLNLFFKHLVNSDNELAKEVGLDFLNSFAKTRIFDEQLKFNLLNQLQEEVFSLETSKVSQELSKVNHQILKELDIKRKDQIEFAINNLLYDKEENVK